MPLLSLKWYLVLKWNLAYIYLKTIEIKFKPRMDKVNTVCI